jgi:hypothetical protein
MGGLRDELQTARKKMGELTRAARDHTASPAGNANAGATPTRTIQTEAHGVAIPAPAGETDAGHYAQSLNCPHPEGSARRGEMYLTLRSGFLGSHTWGHAWPAPATSYRRRLMRRTWQLYCLQS